VSLALLRRYFDELPEPREGESARRWSRRLTRAISSFKRKVGTRYSEGTLQRLLQADAARTRRAAALALGMLGTLDSNGLLALALKDEEFPVRQTAADALWAIWFRADSRSHNRELQRLIRMADPLEAQKGLAQLIEKAPNFAEAYNQRAILHFRLGEYHKSIADCEEVLRLNPFHFGARAGLGQCYMKLRRPRAALQAFRKALAVNPDLDGVQDAVRNLEESLGGEGRKDERK
jgi:tetratricopeptide (TPR) repeat protein